MRKNKNKETHNNQKVGKNLLQGIAIVISLFSVCVTIYFNWDTRVSVEENRIQQVSVSSKTNRKITPESIIYDIQVNNQSDLVIYEVTLIAPDSLTKFVDGKISQDINTEKLNGIYIGELAPNEKMLLTIEMINSKEAQLGEFSMEFQDIKGNWWVKEVGKIPRRVKNTSYGHLVDVISLEQQ